MKQIALARRCRFAVVLICWLLMVSLGFAADPPKEMGGWEKGGTYDKHYVPSQRDSFKGIVVGFKEIVPLPGMSPGIALLVKDADGEVVTVHLGPKWFVTPEATGIKKDDKVKVKGVWTEIGGKDVFIAGKVSKGDFFEYKLRLTKDGTPFWTLSPEELAKERSQKTE